MTTALLELPHRQSEAADLVNQALEVLGEANKLEADLQKVVAEARGFIIDRSLDNATRFEAAKHDVSVDLIGLRALMADSSSQQDRLGRLENLVAGRVAVMSDVVGRLRAENDDGANRNIRMTIGTPLIDQVNAIIEEIRSEETMVQEQRAQASRLATQRTLDTMAGCGIVVAAAVGFSTLLLAGSVGKRRYVQALQRSANDLERRLEERTVALGACEARFRMVSEQASDIFSIFAADGSQAYASSAVERIFGVSSEELIGQGLPAFARPEDRAALETLSGQLLRGAVEEGFIQFCVRRPDGVEVWLENTARTIRDPVSAALTGYTVVSRDVTATQRAETALRASEARYRALTENSADAIILIDMNLVWTYVSPAFHTLFGYEPQEVVGASSNLIIHPDDADDRDQQMRRVVEEKAEHGQVTFRLRHKAGHWIWTQTNFALLRDETTGQPVSIISMMRDVTERHAQAEALGAVHVALAKARDEAAQSSDVKSRFVAGMSHELRTPLNGILGYAQLLNLEGDLNPTQNMRVDAILKAGGHLLAMINRVLDLSRIENELGEPRQNKVDLREVVHAAMEAVRPLAQAKGLHLKISEAPDIPPEVMTDPVRVRQVLLNLLGNAVKFTPHGAVTVRLRLVSEGTAIQIEVIDTGPGIPPDWRHRLFHGFEQLSAESASVEGSGLGLALSAKLAAMTGGRVDYRDNPEGGSVFWLELPVADSRAEPPAAQVSLASEQIAPDPIADLDRSFRVLVVDDVAMNRDIAGSFLKAAGHAVTYAAGGLEAVEAAAADDFDAVLMDVRMPQVDGLEATRRIRKLAGTRGQVPIVALTAQAFPEQIERCRQAGMDSHLAKPFDKDDLLAIVVHAATALRDAHPPSPAGPDIDGGAPNQPTLGLDPSSPARDQARFDNRAAFLAADDAASHVRTVADR